MNFTDRNRTPRPAGENARDALVRRWYATSQGLRVVLAVLRDPRLRGDIQHMRGEQTAEPEPEPPVDGEDEELLWELRRLIASSGGTIADVAHALERRGDEVDRKGRELLGEEVRAVEVDIAILQSLLSDPIDWDQECGRLLAGEISPYDDDLADDEDA
jgi:hypothetical protein